jgi:hypothetical protein
LRQELALSLGNAPICLGALLRQALLDALIDELCDLGVGEP